MRRYEVFGDSSLRTFTYKRYRYVGKERDSESGLYYYGARYYSAWTCRFISVDPLASKYVHITPYNYADNNPINDYDIDGQQDKNTQQTGGSAPADGGGGGQMTNHVTLDEVEITATRTYPSAASTGATSTTPPTNITPGDGWLKRNLNTPENRERYRAAATAYALHRLLQSGGELAERPDDNHITTGHLGYQWIMGTGKSKHTFTENSIMGRQMLATTEIQGAMQTAIMKAASGDNSSTPFARSAAAESKADYIKSFATDFHNNPARAMHGSFFGDITTKSTILPDGKNLLVTMTIRFTDKMTAISATHIPGVGSYDESAIGYTNNPYGKDGQFRTITNNYNMKVSMVVPIMPQAGQSAPSTLTAPIFKR